MEQGETQARHVLAPLWYMVLGHEATQVDPWSRGVAPERHDVHVSAVPEHVRQGELQDAHVVAELLKVPMGQVLEHWPL